MQRNLFSKHLFDADPTAYERIDSPPLFQYLTADCKPIAAKSRRYSYEDREFIIVEVQRLLEEGVIEPSDSPWRSQVVLTRNEKEEISD